MNSTWAGGAGGSLRCSSTCSRCRANSTGSKSAAALARCRPPYSRCATRKASSPSIPPKVSSPRHGTSVPDPRAEFRQGDAQALAIETASRDAVVSALTLNFVPDRAKALAEMKRVARPGGTVAFYVWDYPGGGLEFLRAFWTHAAALDPKGVELTEVRRFPFCTPDGLTALAREAGLAGVSCEAIETPTVFSDFDDYWRPFTMGAGPAPGYVASLAPDARERLKDRLEASLPRDADGSIALKARAWAVKAKAE